MLDIALQLTAALHGLDLGVPLIAEAGHVLLVEGFAERICELAFDDRRVLAVKVEVEKLDIFADVGGVGTLIEKFRPQN